MFLAILTLFLPFGAEAQKLEQWFEKELPDISFMAIEEFEAVTTLYEDVPLGDPSLAYRVRLPQEWLQREVINDTNAVLTGLAPQEVAFYSSPTRPDEQSLFKITAIDLPAPVSAEDWFLEYVVTNGLTLEGIRIYNRHKVEALIVKLEKDITYVIRVVAKVVGDRIVLAQFYVPTTYWQQERVLQAQAIDSFELTNEEAVTFEGVERFLFPNIASFAYPDNWKIQKSRLYSDERLYLQLLKNSGRQFLDGVIDVDVIPRELAPDIGTEIANLHLRAANMRFTIGDIIRREKGYNFSDWLTYGVVEIYNAKHRQQGELINHEFWIAVLVSEDHYFFIMMLTPSKKDELAVWSENASTFQSVVESFAYVEPDIAEVRERKEMMRDFRVMGLEAGND